MGVHDLWRLLAPCGHRLSLTTLTRRKLAVDVSIWLQQFVKALPTSQPHLLGLLRRLCKLHYYHIYPVMVFDGPAPNLKKRTLDERRRTRERQRESFERVAERLLLEQLKMRSVKELRRQMARKKKEQQQKEEEEEKEKGVEQQKDGERDDEMEDDDVIVVGDETSSPGGQSKKAAVKVKKKRGRAAAASGDDHKDDPALMTVVDELDDDPELLLLRQLQQEEDANASLDLIAQWEGQLDENERSAAPALFVAQPLTALTAEERKLGLAYDYISPDEEDDDPLPVHDPLSYQLPASGELDSSVLASLPISLQYSLLEQHRSHHHNMSLRRYAQVKDDTAAFSAMQMGAFLKQVAFNKEIELKRLEMNVREERDGMMVKRLAGDGSREYVYMRKEERKEKEERQRQEEEKEEETRRKEEARQQMQREDSRYLSSHINRLKAQDEVEWRCAECGARNRDEENDVAGMCGTCGARRTERHPTGGTVGILLGGDEPSKPAKHSTAAKATKQEDRVRTDGKASKRVTTFHTASSTPSVQPSAAVYWSCTHCSFLNHTHVVKCEICGAKKEEDAHMATLDHQDTQPQPKYEHRTAPRSSDEVVHMSDDELNEQRVERKNGRKEETPRLEEESKVEQPPAAPVVSSSQSVEISFDAAAMDEGDDLFPADFFDAFDQPQPARTESQHPLAPHHGSVTAAVPSTESIASPTKTHLTLGQSIKQRRPRMRLKKLDVKEIIWFDEDEQHTQHTFDKDADTLVAVPTRPRPAAPAAREQQPPPPPPPPPAYVDEVKEDEQADVPTVYDERAVSDNDDVEEIVVRGRVKVVPKAAADKRLTAAVSEPEIADGVKLTERFLEQDDDASRDVRMEGKYDGEEENKYDSDGERQQHDESRVDDEEDVDEKEQLKRAIALSMTYPVHRMDTEEAEEEVQEVSSRHEEASRRRSIVIKTFSPRARERRMLETIAEEEAEMAVELKEQQTADDIDEVTIVEQETTTAAAGQSDAVSESATVSITTLQHTAVRAEEEETGSIAEQADNLLSSAQVSAALPEPSPAATSAPDDSPSVSTVAAAPHGFVLPSLSSLATRAAAQPTNLFFAEKQKREQEKKEREAAQTSAAAAQNAAPNQLSTSSPASTSATSSSSSQSTSDTSPPTASSPSLSAFPSSAPIAMWTSASDDPTNAAEPSVDAHLSEIYTDSHALSSSLSRLKSKQAKQQQQVTAAMLDECRHLLALFGCPYIIAPAEAEAQCATLEQLGLVDGVVTEDSDVFLFGAKHVYRNIFEQKKYAERYRIDEIAAVLGVDRDGLISLALLLGSDYTLGVHGVGIVNAMEIVNAFPGQGNDGLREFREWVYSGSVEKRPKLPQLLEARDGETETEKAVRDKHNAGLVADYRKRLFKFKHRNLRSSWHVSRDFPSDAVRKGYEQPMVDSSEEPLSWSKPRWDDIIAFLRDKFKDEEEERRRHGSSIDGQEDEYVSMVKTLRVAYEDEEAKAAADPYYQSRLDSYFKDDDKFAVVASKRINTAILGLTKKKAVEERLREKEAKRRKKQQQRQDGVEESDDKENEAVASPQNVAADGDKGSPARGGKRGRGGRGRGGGRGGRDMTPLQAARREAHERRQREDAVWLDDDVVLVEDDEGEDDWTNAGGANRGRGRGRGRGTGGASRSRGGNKGRAV